MFAAKTHRLRCAGKQFHRHLFAEQQIEEGAGEVFVLADAETQRTTKRRETYIHTHTHANSFLFPVFEQRRMHTDFSDSFDTSPPQKGVRR